MNRFERADEKPFEAANVVSEFNQRLYELFGRPIVKAFANEYGAKLSREFHPLRFQRWAFSDLNPWLSWLAPAAQAVKASANRFRLDHPARQIESTVSEMTSASLDCYRALRDAAAEATFFQIYGNLDAFYLADQRGDKTSAQPKNPRELPFVKEALASIEQGGYAEALARVGYLMAHEDVPLPLSRLHLAKELIEDYRDLLPKLPFEEMRRIGGKQEIIARYERDKAIETLPRCSRSAKTGSGCSRCSIVYSPTSGCNGSNRRPSRRRLSRASAACSARCRVCPAPLATVTVREEQQRRQDQAIESSSAENLQGSIGNASIERGGRVARGASKSRPLCNRRRACVPLSGPDGHLGVEVMVDLESRSLLAGRKGLVVGMANEHSIAYGCARMFRDCGAELAVTWINEKTRGYVEPLARELAATITMPLDVEKPGEMEAVFDAIRGRWGRLDFLLHSIAFAPPQDLRGRVTDTSRDGFAPCDGYLVPLLHADSTAGRATDGQGRHAADDDLPRRHQVVPNYGVMGPVKAALEATVRYLATEFGPRGIRVNAVSPGPIKTRAASGIPEFDELFEQARRRAPLTREVEIDDVGSLCAFLVSDAAQAITGDVHYVDGGFHILA